MVRIGMAVGTLVLLGLATASAQSPAQLGTPSVRWSEEFSRIAGVRELSDGRVIVSDAAENRLVILPARGGPASAIGRTGAGPGEFGQAGWLFAGAGDTTYMADINNRRVAGLLPNGSIARDFLPMSGPGFFAIPSVRDREGRFYGSGALVAAANDRSQTPVVRWTPGKAPDTLAMVPNARSLSGGVRVGAGGAVEETGKQLRTAFERSPRWFATPDARLAILQVEPYRVDWVNSDGEAATGVPIPFDPVPVRDADRTEWVELQASAPKPIVQVSPEARARAATERRMMRAEAGSGIVPDPLTGWHFPTNKPAWQDALMSPEGMLWVRRYRAAGATRELYDVIDQRGQRIRQVELPADRTLIGFGAGVVYLVATDVDDLQTLERHRVP